MSNLHVKYLLIGGGLASSAAAEAIRASDREGRVLLVGQEINRPYRRTLLSSAYLLREASRDALFTHPAAWYEGNGVELRTGRRVAHLDTARHAAILNSGEEISYDTALLATGATPKALEVPGARLPNLYYLRTIEDADRLHNAIDKARREGRGHDKGRGRAVVIGGGVLGVELAATFTGLGLAVDLVVAHPHPWSRFAGENAGRLIAAHLQRNGVTVHLSSPARRLEGDGRVQRVVAGDDQRVLPCDFAVAAVGVAANKELLRGTPIEAGKAILVDEQCRTSVPNVFAAGDCASVFDAVFGKHRGLAYWDDAAGTGSLAGLNMAGGRERYVSTGSSSTQIFGLQVGVWGEARLIHRRVVRGTPSAESPQLVEFGVAADGRLAHVLSIGAGQETVLAQLVARRTHIDGNEETLRDPSVPLDSLL